MLLFVAVWAGTCFFCCLGGGAGPAQTAKKINTSPLLPSVFFFFLLFGRVGVFTFLLLGPGAFFLLFGQVRVDFFAVWGGSFLFFCCLGGGVFFLFGRGTGVHSLSGLPGSSSSDPTTKKTKQQKKKTFPE